jgi:two-component system response regulator (stage 0 sporulation protein F)
MLKPEKRPVKGKRVQSPLETSRLEGNILIPYNILVVDDQEGVRQLLYEAFSEEGYHIEMAASGREAIQKVLANAPDLILLDNKMPSLTGLETAMEIRKFNKQVLIVIMTAYGELNITAQAKKIGINHHIDKPFDLNEIRYLVKTLLEDYIPKKSLAEIN